MQVILLAAGQSTRLSPIEDKNLLEFAGKTLIEYQVTALKQAKLRDIVVVGNKHNLKRITTVLKGYKNVAVTEQKDLEEGMKGGVLAGAKVVGHKNVLVMSTNDVFDVKLFEDMIQASKQKDVDGVIAGKKVNSYFPGGYLKLDKKGFLTDVIEKPGEGKEPGNLVNLVCHIYNDFPKFTKYLKDVKSKRDDKYEVALDNYIKKGKARMLVQAYKGEWRAIKYPWHILQLMNHFLETQTAELTKGKPKIDRSAKIAKSAVIEGDVIIEKGVKVLHNAVIKGPAYIGEGSVIANNALVRNSMIGKNCVIGYCTEVARSYLNHDVWMHSNYLGDSIIDHNVSLGAGTVLGNLRFDEKTIKVNVKKERIDTGMNKLGAIIGSGARFGINSSTNPGVKIGKDCFIGGNVLVEKDVEDGKLVLLDNKLKITYNHSPVSIKDRSEMKKNLRK
ncbi:NTP transferase domain-containing protein [Patescibacteria group bacterium]|nr:NTP transferase domain-containing protein [Patescibacteria group bacterium]MBU1015743.1 NTP transferase domain-containing protein [Patescibacteria group bacterium]MBU1685505.1 NTP transferase domain-containing protein [Patescibacteria group bacterium]MBU1938709.1 NTP transferase domain-containing protein [Patescibacteria group bacterium]